MRHHLLAIPILFLGLLAGCVWPPDSTATGNNQGNNYPNYSSFYVHRISQRSLSGAETLVTIVSPDYYNTFEAYPDSVQYIVVNGDTAYRHPVIPFPPVYDSAAPYHLDGSVNFVTIVYASTSITDTTYDADLLAQITEPTPGDTIQRTSDAIFGFQTEVQSSSSQSATLQLTDSVQFYPRSVESNNGTIDFPYYDLETFQPGTLWADLQLVETEYVNNYNYEYQNQRVVTLDRIIAYPLH
jgi:hypothetical protein